MLKNFLKYYIAEAPDEQLQTRSIIRRMNEGILDDIGFTALNFRHTKGWPGLVKISRFFDAVTMALKIRKGDEVLFHFPLQAKMYQFFLAVLKWRGIATMALIIDIDGLKDKNEILLQEEIAVLKNFKWLIAHNQSMKHFLLQYLPGASIVCINLFDYPFNDQSSERRLSNNICIATNLAETRYLYGLNRLKDVFINLYGDEYEVATQKDETHISYKGVLSPDMAPEKLEGSFGLVWEGESIEECDPYLKYNNPHKLSMYLVAGLPVIVWEDSAIADFVRDNGLGFTIKSLAEMPGKISALSNAEYNLMCHHVQSIAEKVSKGFFLKKVIRELREQKNR